uniref:(northern house mosquito) hypothetical protein n=1 Tax=Culex pipiens TaxID=7175 RepID=A0A8D8BJC5_CULPI
MSASNFSTHKFGPSHRPPSSTQNSTPVSFSPLPSFVVMFPPEVWAQIFQHLDVPALKQVRQTCSYLKATVDENSCFMGQVRLKLPETTTLDRFFGVDVPARSVLLRSSRVEAVELWWPRVGRWLYDLQLERCRMSVSTLVGMLRATPQLKRLTLKTVEFSTGVVGEGFRLDKLEELVVDCPDESGVTLDLLPAFGSGCPRLKSFTYLYPKHPEVDQLKVVDFLKQVQGTIEEVKLFYSEFVMDAIAEMERMDNLKCVTFISNNPFFRTS